MWQEGRRSECSKQTFDGSCHCGFTTYEAEIDAESFPTAALGVSLLSDACEICHNVPPHFMLWINKSGFSLRRRTMRYCRYFFAVAVLGGMIILPQTGSGSPLAASLTAAGSTTPPIVNSLIQKVHGWHCAKKKGWYKGDKVWHRHRRACYETQVYDDDYYYDDYPYSGRPPNLYINPGIRLYFGNRGDHH